MDFYFLLHKGGEREREREREEAMSEGKLIHDIIGELFIQKDSERRKKKKRRIAQLLEL